MRRGGAAHDPGSDPDPESSTLADGHWSDESSTSPTKTPPTPPSDEDPSNLENTESSADVSNCDEEAQVAAPGIDGVRIPDRSDGCDGGFGISRTRLWPGSSNDIIGIRSGIASTTTIAWREHYA